MTRMRISTEFRPEAGESLHGVLLRLAVALGHRNVGELLAGTGFVCGRRLAAEAPVLEARLGLAPGLLSRYRRRPPSARRFEWTALAPVCPACLAEERVHDEAWRRVWVIACPIHGCDLVDRCEVCGETLTIARTGLRRCGCGAAYARMRRTAAEPLHVAVAALVADAAHPSRGCLPGELATRTPPDVEAFLFTLAARSRIEPLADLRAAGMPQTLAGSKAFLQPALSLLATWPDAFDAEVARRLQAGDPDAPSAPARLGAWYHAVMRFRGAAYAPFRERIARVVAASYDGAYRGALATESAAPTLWVSAAAFASAVGVRPERVVAAVAEGRLPGRLRHSGFGHRHCTLPRGLIAPVIESRARFVDARAAAARLGVTRTQFALMREAGIITAHDAADRPPLTDGGFDLAAIDRLETRLRDRAVAVDGETLALRDITLRRTTDRGAILAVLRAVADGVIPVAQAAPGSALGAYRFASAAVADRIARLRRGDGLTAEQVAALLGVKHRCVTHWAEAGLLEAVGSLDAMGRGRTWAVAPDALARFQARYVPLSILAREAGARPRTILRGFAERGLLPVGEVEDGPARRGYLFHLGDLTAALLRPPRSARE